MAKERRVLRLQQLILEIVAETLQQEVEDPRLRLVSVTRVRLSSDLEHAVVYWSSLAKEDKGREATTAALAGVLPLLQARVAEDLSTRVTPRLELRFDPSLERAQRLESIFARLREERGEEGQEEDEAGGDEALDELPPVEDVPENPPASG